MTKLSEESRDELRLLLGRHQDVSDAAIDVSEDVDVCLTISRYDEDGDEDFLYISLDGDIANRILDEQRKAIELKLEGYGVQIE